MRPDPDPVGPKTYGSDGSWFGSATLVVWNCKLCSSNRDYTYDIFRVLNIKNQFLCSRSASTD